MLEDPATVPYSEWALIGPWWPSTFPRRYVVVSRSRTDRDVFWAFGIGVLRSNLEVQSQICFIVRGSINEELQEFCLIVAEQGAFPLAFLEYPPSYSEPSYSEPVGDHDAVPPVICATGIACQVDEVFFHLWQATNDLVVPSAA